MLRVHRLVPAAARGEWRVHIAVHHLPMLCLPFGAVGGGAGGASCEQSGFRISSRAVTQSGSKFRLRKHCGARPASSAQSSADAAEPAVVKPAVVKPGDLGFQEDTRGAIEQLPPPLESKISSPQR